MGRKLVFWNNGTPRFVNSDRVELPDGSIILAAKPDPSIDLYDWGGETGPAPGMFEVAGPSTWDNDGFSVTKVCTVVEKPLEACRAMLIGNVKTLRVLACDGGISWSPDGGVTTYQVQTDRDSRREMTGAVVGINESLAQTQDWRMGDNTVITLTTVNFKSMAMAVCDHVNAAYQRQAELEVAINAASTVAALQLIDVTTGWG